jgi:hypothetical protein
MTYGTAHVIVAADEEAVVTIQVREKAASMTGTVLDQQGRPANIPFSITFRTEFEGGAEIAFKTLAEENGHYGSGPLLPGHYVVFGSTRVDGYAIEPREWVRVTLGAGDHVVGPDFVITPMTGFVAGTVVYPDGTPAVGKGVFVGGREGLARGMTDAQGRFSVDKIDGDDLYVQVGQPGRSGYEGDSEWLYVRGIRAGTDDLKLVLEPIGILKGILVLRAGEPLDLGITVQGELGYQDSVRLKDTEFELPLQPDRYQVVISSSYGSRTIEDAMVEPDMVTDLGEIELIPEECEPAD